MSFFLEKVLTFVLVLITPFRLSIESNLSLSAEQRLSLPAGAGDHGWQNNGNPFASKASTSCPVLTFSDADAPGSSHTLLKLNRTRLA